MKDIVRSSMIVLACALVSVGCERSANMSSQLRSLVEAELRFARAAETFGIRAAFLAYLAEDAIVFRPIPVNGRQWYLGQQETKALLSWEPVLANVARAGDLGYTTGPWSYSPEGPGSDPNIFGEYVSVWRRRPGGKWQVVIDVGISHEKPASSKTTVAVAAGRRPGRQKPSGDIEVTLDGLLGVDRQFSTVSESRGNLAAYEEFAADDIRVCRMDAFPTTGKELLKTIIGDENRHVSYQPASGGVSRSGDLGYTYGTGRIVSHQSPDGEKENESYMRIWSREPGSSWKIVLDIRNPVTATPDETEQ